VRNRSKTESENVVLPASKPWFPATIEWLIVGCLVVNCGGRSIAGTAHGWRDRSGVRVASTEIVKMIESNLDAQPFSKDGVIVYVLGEPAVVFDLRADGLANVAPVQDLDFIGQRQPLPTFVILGNQTVQRGLPAAKFPKLARCKQLLSQRVRNSHLVEMDSQNQVQSPVADLSFSEIWLYRVPE
jgi:hypothetical protein